MARRAYSLRRGLLAWLLISTVVIGALALIDTYREAVKTANIVSDRVLAGSALAIAERVVVAEDGSLEVDIPYVALEMLTSAAQDRVFYRVDGPPGQFITGYQNLPSVANLNGQSAVYTDAQFRGEPIRVAALERSASTGINSVPFVVTVAETTIARRQLTQAILLRSAFRLLMMILGAAAIVWIAVTFSLRPLYRLGDAIAERSPDDLHPIDQSVPSEVEGLVETVNSFMVRLQSALDALRHFSGNASHQLRHNAGGGTGRRPQGRRGRCPCRTHPGAIVVDGKDRRCRLEGAAAARDHRPDRAGAGDYRRPRARCR
jgi:two-component system sensor histidine kinase TctE